VDEETRNISYVSFDLVPSAKDSADALQQVMLHRDEFATATGSDMRSFLERAGSVASFDSTYNSKDAIQSSFKDTLVKQPIGSVYGPFVESGLYVLAKITGQRSLPDSVKCRHILLGTSDRQGNPLLPDSIAKAKADSVAAAIRGGASFDALEAQYSTDDVAGKDKGVMTFPTSQIQGPGFAPEFAKFILTDGRPGDKKVVKTSFGYHYIEVLEHKNPKPNYQVAYLAKPIQPSSATVDEAMSQAQQFAGSSRNQKEYTANLDKFKKQSFQSAEIRRNDFEIQGLGESRELVRWVYDNEPGDVSDKVFDLKEKFIIPMVTNVQEKGLMNPTKARPMVEHLIRNEKKAKQIIEQKFKGDNLESYAQSAGYPIARADSLSFSSSFVAPMGMEPKLVGVAFNRSMVNKVTAPIAGATGVFAARPEAQGARPSGGSAEDLRKTLEGQLRSRSGYESLNALKKIATIKDYRHEFY
jgi:peptidyl-prolyl cis-trans isomerase D